MLRIGGKGGGGVGQLLAAVAAALLLRLFSAPGPELLPEEEDEEGQVPAEGKVAPVTIKWTNINCSLSDKSSKSVSVCVCIEQIYLQAEHCSLPFFIFIRLPHDSVGFQWLLSEISYAGGIN